MEAEELGDDICPRCNQIIDSDMCWCGEYIADHGYYSGHCAVPMGCICYFSKKGKDNERIGHVEN